MQAHMGMNQDKGPYPTMTRIKNDKNDNFRSGSEMMAVMTRVSQHYLRDEGNGRVLAPQLRTDVGK